MSEGRSSSDLRSLFAAAKGDAPSAAARAKVWGGVSHALGAAASGGTAGIAGVGAAKMLVVGTLLGGTVSAGIAATAIYLRSVLPTSPNAAVDRVAAVHDSFDPGTPPCVATPRAGTRPAGADRGDGATPRAGSLAGANAVPVVFSPTPSSGPEVHGHGSGLRVVTVHPARVSGAGASSSNLGGDDLAREAAFLSSARSALASGDAASALRALRAASTIRDRQLVPEGLALEAQALRALGRDAEASAVEARIKTLYPESALAR
jgi:hypothetical protein